MGSRLLKIYCGLFLVAFLAGVSGVYNPYWAWVQIVTTQLTLSLLKPAFLCTVGSPVIALVVRFLTPWRVRDVLRVLFWIVMLSLFHYTAAVTATVAPRRSALLALGLVAAVAVALAAVIPLVGRHRVLGLVRGRAQRLAAVLFVGLTVVGTLAFGMTFGNVRLFSHPVDSTGEVQPVGTFSEPYDVRVLGDSGKIAVLSGGDHSIHRVDATTHQVEATVLFPKGLRPQRSVFDRASNRLFAIGYRPGRNDIEAAGVAVVTVEPFEIQQWLSMPGCQNAINLDMSPDGTQLVALCEPKPYLYLYDLPSLELARREKIPENWFFMGYDLEFLGPELIVSSSLWPLLFRGAPNPADPAGPREWTTHRITSMAIPMAAAADGQRLFVSLPLQHQIGVFHADGLEKGSAIRTAGFSRDLALAPERGWLFTAGYFNGVVEQLDTSSGERLHRWQVGPLLRGLEWDPSTGTLYTASLDGVHRIRVGPLE